MSPNNKSLEDFAHERRPYTNSHGVSFCWVESKNYLRVSYEVKSRAGRDGSTLVLYKHFDAKIYTMLLFFGFTKVSDLETINQQLLWKLFNEGRFFLGCQVNNHSFSLSVPKGREGNEIEITSEDDSGELVKYEMPKEVFLTEDDYLNCCAFVYPELMKPQPPRFSGIKELINKFLEWFTGNRVL